MMFNRIVLECKLKIQQLSHNQSSDPDPLVRARARDATWLKDWLRQRRFLSSFCRKVLRKHYKADLAQLLKSIDYPTKLKKFLRTEILSL